MTFSATKCLQKPISDFEQSHLREEIKWITCLLKTDPYTENCGDFRLFLYSSSLLENKHLLYVILRVSTGQFLNLCVTSLLRISFRITVLYLNLCTFRQTEAGTSDEIISSSGFYFEFRPFEFQDRLDDKIDHVVKINVFCFTYLSKLYRWRHVLLFNS